MGLRIFIMSGIYSTLLTFVGIFNAKVLIVGHMLGVELANFLDIDPYLSLSMNGVGIAYDLMFILFFSVIILEFLVSEKVCMILDYLDTLLWKLLKC